MWLFKQSVSKLKEKRDIPRLINMFNDEDYKVAIEAREALIEIGDVDTIPVLFDFHNNKVKRESKYNVVSAILGIAKKYTSAQLSQLRYLNLLDLRDAESSNNAALTLLIDCFGDPKYESFLIQEIQSTDYPNDDLNIYRKCGCSPKNLAPILTNNQKSIFFREKVLATMISFGDSDISKVLQEVLKSPIVDPDAGKRDSDSVSENMIADHPDWYRNPSFFQPKPDRAPDFIAKIKEHTQ